MRQSLFLLVFSSSILACAIILPSGTGPFGTHFITKKITDHKRVDPYSPDGRNRSLMISILSPVATHDQCQNSTAQYMPRLTAAVNDQLYIPISTNGTFEAVKLQTCNAPLSADNELINGSESLPIVIFSPGLGNSRLLYSAVSQSVASHGMHVITIDHPYDASVVEYPDHSYVLAANITTDEEIENDIKTRVGDVSFVIDLIANGTLPHLHPLSGSDQILMFGHSVGGATVLSAMLNDSRILAGANMDGKFFPGVLPSDQRLENPFLLVGNQRRNVSTDSTWDLVVQEYLTGPKREVQLEGTEHGSFTDFPVLLEAVGTDNSTLQELESVIGSLGGTELVRELTDVLVTFFRAAANEHVKDVLRTGRNF